MVGHNREDYSSSPFKGTVIGVFRREKGMLNQQVSSPSNRISESQNATNGYDLFSGSTGVTLLLYFPYRTFRYSAQELNAERASLRTVV